MSIITGTFSFKIPVGIVEQFVHINVEHSLIVGKLRDLAVKIIYIFVVEHFVSI